MITATIEIKELPNGVVTVDFRPDPHPHATKGERRVASIVDFAVQAAMQLLLQGSSRGELVEAATNDADITDAAEAIKQRASNLPPA